MRLWNLCIERPVLATVLSLVVVLFGLVALGRVPNREFPDIEAPIVSVTTLLPGAAPEVVETSVTQPLEDQLVGIAGIRHITSTSAEQVSQITIEFELARDVDLAANDVRDRVARARADLPEDVEEPVVAKRDADGSPIMWLALYGGGYDQIELSTLAETQLQDRLGKLPGVSEVLIAGEQRFSMRVWIDNARLTAQGLTIADVAQALERGNVDIPSGRVEGRDTEFTVRTLGEMHTPEAFGALVVARTEAGPVRLRDVARVAVGPEDERKLVRFNREPAVALGVVKQSKANTLDVARAVKAEVEELRPLVPAGVQFDAAFDSSIFIERSLSDVWQTLGESIVLVVVVIYLFLRTMRATLIPAITIPVSLIGTFAVLYFMGFTVNTLTLMGLVLAIGLVVDDAIVVLENVTRWVEGGMAPREAAHKGIDEIAFAVIAATVSTVAVFGPLAFLTDKTGRLFREFGMTVAAAVAISGWVALTLSPMLCARILRPHGPEHGLKRLLGRSFDAMESGYARVLVPAVRRRGAVLLMAAAWVALGFGLLRVVPREFVPTEDRGVVVTFTRAPEGSTLDYTDRYQKQAEEIVLAVPEVEKTFSVIALGIGAPGAVNEGAMFTSLHPWEKRERSQQAVVEQLRGEMTAIAGIQAFPANLPSLGGDGAQTPVSLVLQGPDVGALARYADDIVRRGQAIPGIVNLRTDLLLNKPQLEIDIDRDRASDLGVAVRDIATTLQVLLGGLDLSTFKLRGETYDVIAQLDRDARATPRDLYGLYVRGAAGRLVPIASVARVRETVTPRSLPHFDRMRSATLSAGLAQGAPAEEVLPDGQGYRVTVAGESEDFYESTNALLFAYVLAVLIVYLVLAAQFESFLDPLTILVAVALSFTGALVALLATGQTLNLYSQIGLVMLVGLVTKNSILIVEFANQLHAAGRGLVDATITAARTRFRPIVMTALSTIVGILPIALGLGTGGESRAPLGIAVVGGMVFSTLLTFVVVPGVHLALQSLRERMAASGATRLERRAA
jgi:multidrug efflux pump